MGARVVAAEAVPGEELLFSTSVEVQLGRLAKMSLEKSPHKDLARVAVGPMEKTSSWTIFDLRCAAACVCSHRRVELV